MLVSVRPKTKEHIDIRTALISDPRLSAESLGLLCFVLLVGRDKDVSTDRILACWNLNRPKELHIGKDKLRRIVNEWRKAGYASVVPKKDTEGKLTDKSLMVLDETLWPQDASSFVPAEVEVPVEKVNMHKFPAAQIFQETFAVDLDLDSLKHIEKEVAKDYKTWSRVCADHYASLTQQQKDNIAYRTRAVKFVLADMRREVELASYRKTKTPMQKVDEAPPPKKRSFADYVAAYKHGSMEYDNFKKNWLRKAKEKDNDEAIAQVDEYERIQLSLARIKETKRSVKE